MEFITNLWEILGVVPYEPLMPVENEKSILTYQG